MITPEGPESLDDQLSHADLEDSGQNPNIENPVRDEDNVFAGDSEQAANDAEELTFETDEEAAERLSTDDEKENKGHNPYDSDEGMKEAA